MPAYEFYFLVKVLLWHSHKEIVTFRDTSTVSMINYEIIFVMELSNYVTKAQEDLPITYDVHILLFAHRASSNSTPNST